MADYLISPLSQESLNIDSIKESLRQYYIDNSTVTDVDYDASVASVLNQINAYIIQSVNATHAMNANQSNLILSDVRQNIIYEAQTLGYNITRPISSKMQISVTANSDLTIEQFTEFTCAEYTFLNTEQININAGETKTFQIVEGIYIDYNTDSELKYTPSTISKSKLLSYTNIENDNLYISVNKNMNGYNTYSKVDNLFEVDLSDYKYFVEFDPETEFINIVFSYLLNSNKITQNDEVNISFILSNGSSANGIADCTLDIDGTIVVDVVSSGGSDVEDNESIRTNSPIFYNTGNRTVNEIDYTSFLIKNSLVKKATAWGGEKAYPKQLGYTYISVIPETSDYISTLEESTLIDYLAKPRIIATGKYIVQPVYFEIDINIKILGTVSNLTEKKNEILTNINQYFETVYNFNKNFYESKIIRTIENVFVNDMKSSVYVTIQPKIKIDTELFNSNTIDIYIPNSNKKYYLEKEDVVIDLPEDYQDIESYIVNGWVKVVRAEEDLSIDFSGIINSKNISISDVVDGTIDIDSNVYDYYNVFLELDIIGIFIKEINIFRLNDISTELSSNDYINLSYSPQMNVLSERNSIIKLGSINYI